MRRKQLGQTHRLTRRGVVISPRVHWARLVVYMILIPLLTWYGNQKYTNPFRLHPNIALVQKDVQKVISFYETTYKDTFNRIDVYIDEPPLHEDSSITTVVLNSSGITLFCDSIVRSDFSSQNYSISYRDSVAQIQYFDQRLVIPFTETLKSLPFNTDILVISEHCIEVGKKWRNHIAPRVTVWLDSLIPDSPDNIFFWNNGSHEITQGKYRVIDILEIESE